MVKTNKPMLIALQMSRKLGLVTFNLVVQRNNTNIVESWEDWKRPYSKNAELLPKQNVKTQEQVLKVFPDVFDGTGCLPGEYTINTDPKVPPVVYPLRRVPVSLREKFKAELDSLEKQGIISLITKPTSWINSFVSVSKENGSVILCLNPKDINKAIQRPHFVTPTFGDVVFRLQGAKSLTTVDVKSRYW